MAKRSLFSILRDLPWWVSLLVAALVYAVGALFSPLIGAAACSPFVGVAGYVGWLRIKRGPELDAPALLKALRGAAPQEMRAMLTEAFGPQGYQISDAAGGDLRLERNGYVTLVRFRRWRAQSTHAAALEELAEAMRAQSADHAIYVTAGGVADSARRESSASGITLIDGQALAHLVRRTRGARKALERASAEAASP